MYAQLLQKNKKDINLYELYFKNLPMNVRQSQIVNFFNRFVEVKSVRIFNRNERHRPCSSIRFYDFDTMMKVYLKQMYDQSRFGKDKLRHEQMYVQISRKTLLICSKCNKVGHWKNQCKQGNKYHRYDKRHKKDIDKSIEKVPSSKKSYKISESTEDLTKSRCSFYQQKYQQDDDESLQYFCPELQLQEQPKPQVHDQEFTQKQSFVKRSHFKQQEEDQLTQYDDSTQIIQQNQTDLVFVNIQSQKSPMNILSHQENQKLQSLWNSGWFDQIPDSVGPFAKIVKSFPHPLLNE